MYTLDKNNTSLLCILCTLMPQIIPLRTPMLVHMLYEKSTPGGGERARGISVCKVHLKRFWGKIW